MGRMPYVPCEVTQNSLTTLGRKFTDPVILHSCDRSHTRHLCKTKVDWCEADKIPQVVPHETSSASIYQAR